MIGGTVLSALVHPWFYALAAYDVANGAFLTSPAGWLGLPFWLFASLGLGVGYLASMLLGVLALKRRGARDLLSQVPLMPFYWLLISGAAYRAVWQFATAHLGEDRARTWPRHEESRGVFASRGGHPRTPRAGYKRAGREYCDSTRSMTCLASTSASSFCITKVCRVDRANSGRSDRVG
jgi:hypothetical protein